MEIIERKVSELRGYENNSRTHSKQQIGQIAESIKKFGFNDPIEISSDLMVISGHARLSAAILAGFETVPTVTHSHLTKTQQRAYNLAANKIAQNAEWDEKLLVGELEFLRDENFEMELTGFSESEIEELLAGQNIQEYGDEEHIPEIQQEIICRRGDVWILGKHRLMCGDSTNSNDVQILYADNKPILMVTDPPYGVEYEPEWRQEKANTISPAKRNKCAVGKVNNDDVKDWSEAYSLFTGDIAYIWHSGKYLFQAAQSILNSGYEIISQIIWSKRHFVISRGDYHWQHEECFYAVKKGKKHNWQGKRDQSTIWEIETNNRYYNKNAEEQTGHSTQKPIECMSRPIENNSAMGQYVYDPFGGSGTTLIACEKLNRKCLTMEIDEKYCDVIIRRWEKFTGQKAHLDSNGENFSG